MYCSQCGYQIDPQSKFCAQCGSPISQLPAERQTSSQRFPEPELKTAAQPIWAPVSMPESVIWVFSAQQKLSLLKIVPCNIVFMQDKAIVAHLTPERVWKETESALATRNPQVFFQTLRDCRALKVLFPEVDALYGVPAPAKWHPEIDTGLHTLMTVTMAAMLSPEVDVRFATLCHDLGKGLTPKALWPRHHGHGPGHLPHESRDRPRLCAARSAHPGLSAWPARHPPRQSR